MAYQRVRQMAERGMQRHRPLTVKQLSFINAYMGPANFVANKAIELSLYECKTKSSIEQTAAELMAHPVIQAEIKKRTDKLQKKSEITAEYLINKLIEIIDNDELEKTADRLRAVELAGKAIALWKERQEVSGPDGDAIRIEQERKEAVSDFTSRIASLAKRDGTTNVVEFPVSGPAG